jgi:hypothetical protein
MALSDNGGIALTKTTEKPTEKQQKNNKTTEQTHFFTPWPQTAVSSVSASVFATHTAYTYWSLS